MAPPIWVNEQKLVASDGSAWASFGSTVALSADTALVGAFEDGDALGPSAGSAGSAHVYTRNGGRWTEQQKLFETDGMAWNTFGSSVALGADIAIIGASFSGDTGAARVFALKLVNGESCGSAVDCASMQCVDGVCCDNLCDDTCEACNIAGTEGTCTPTPRGSAPTMSCDGHLCNGSANGCPESCAPYLCTGADTNCPTSCIAHPDCSPGKHCANGTCEPLGALGAACTDHEACATSHCTDTICCAAASCGAYRCGAAGACEAACDSSAQCANGHQCNSGGTCEPLPESSSAGESGACFIAGVSSPRSRSLPWLSGLGLLAYLGKSRRCRRIRRDGRQAGRAGSVRTSNACAAAQ